MSKLKKKTIGILFSLFIFLLVMEVGLRLSGKYATLSEKTGNGFLSLFSVTHAGNKDIHTPNQAIHIANSEFSYDHVIDDLGFRNDFNDSAAPFILALGDSFTEGLGAPQDSTWPALLAKLTGRRVYNAGIMGSDPVYGYKLLVDDYFPFKPRQIIFAVNYSDITDAVIRGGEERFLADGSVRYHRPPWFMPLYKYSHLFRAALHLGLRYDYMFNSPQQRETAIQTALDTLAATLVKANAWCTARHISMLVCVHPVPQEYYMNLDRRLDFSRIDTLVPVLIHKGVAAVNLRPAFENRLKTAEEWKAVSWPIDGHFNASGYEIMAELIAKNLPDLHAQKTEQTD